jgi:hypothetical protein
MKLADKNAAADRLVFALRMAGTPSTNGLSVFSLVSSTCLTRIRIGNLNQTSVNISGTR